MMHDLEFTGEEAWQLVSDVSGRELTDARVEQLLARTEGWAVAVHLAAMGLRSSSDPDAYIAGFTGEDRDVAAFLLDEVLMPELPFVRRFLVQTSVLNRLTGSACDALTGNTGGSELLGRLEDGGVFTRRLPDAGQWFVYHPMFRDLLRRELRLEDPGTESQLLVRAAAWHAVAGDLEAAATDLIEAQEWNRLLELAVTHGQSMFEQGRAHALVRWLHTIPANPDDFELALQRAYALTMLGETLQAAQALHGLDTRERSRGQQIAVDALRATWVFFDATTESTIRAAETALRSLDDVEAEDFPDIFGITSQANLTMMAAASRARALWYAGDVTSSRRTLTALARQRDAYAPWLVQVLSALALLEAWAGNLRVARIHASRASAVAAQNGLLEHPAILDARMAGAHVLLERGNLRRSEELLDEARAIAGRTRAPFTLAIHVVERALWHLAGGLPGRGLAEIERYRTAGEPPLPTLVASRLQAVELRLLLMLGHMDRAESILAESTAWPLWAELAAAAVESAVLRGDVATARARLHQWTPTDDAEPRHRLQHELWKAITDFEAGDRREGLRLASEVLNAAAPDGHIRLFLDQGRPAARLLRALVNTSPSPYASRILRSAEVLGATDAAVTVLSRRELEVIRYLPTPLSSAEIAERLYISLNTLKTHLRTIYGKLGVRGREEAIRQAQELGIA